jgi:hypothetical protein
MAATRRVPFEATTIVPNDIDGLVSALEDASSATSDIVAKAIVQVALLGERDRLRLREAALRHLTRRGAMAESH